MPVPVVAQIASVNSCDPHLAVLRPSVSPSSSTATGWPDMGAAIKRRTSCNSFKVLARQRNESRHPSRAKALHRAGRSEKLEYDPLAERAQFETVQRCQELHEVPLGLHASRSSTSSCLKTAS